MMGSTCFYFVFMQVFFTAFYYMDPYWYTTLRCLMRRMRTLSEKIEQITLQFPFTIVIPSLELTCQCFAGFRIFCMFRLCVMDYSFCHRLVSLLYVIKDRALIINPNYPGGFFISCEEIMSSSLSCRRFFSNPVLCIFIRDTFPMPFLPEMPLNVRERLPTQSS